MKKGAKEVEASSRALSLTSSAPVLPERASDPALPEEIITVQLHAYCYDPAPTNSLVSPPLDLLRFSLGSELEELTL